MMSVCACRGGGVEWGEAGFETNGCPVARGM